MLTYQISTERITFQWDDDEAIREVRTGSIKIPEWVMPEKIIPVAEAIKTLCLGGAESSYPGFFDAGRNIFKHVVKNQVAFPPATDGWDNFLLTHYASHLARTELAFKTRTDQWCAIAGLYRKLRSTGFIPTDVYVPGEAPSSFKASDHLTEPLGHKRENVIVPESLQCLLPKKYLIEAGLDLVDDVYLLDLKSTLERRAGVLLECSIDYWDRMLRCHNHGAKLYANITTDEIESVLDSNCFYRNGLHIAHPDSPSGPQWFFSVARYYAEHTDELKTITIKSLGETPFFRKLIHNKILKPKVRQMIRRLVGDDGVNTPTINENLNRLLGYLSPRDCAVACVIIATENPCFNPSSLTNVRLYSQHGTYYLRGFSDTKRITLSVSKPRAQERKVSILPPLSIRIVTDVIRCTSMPRARLLAKRKSGWRKLFLVSSRKQIGSRPGFSCTLSQYEGLSFYDIYENELKAVGISADMVSLFRIRCTQGILEFLLKGSIQAVADLLGNSLQVVRKNYIPEWMIKRWGTRFLRAIHQKFILTATEGMPWQLAASDFETREELEAFIRRVLLGLNKGDALSEAMRSKLNHYSPDANSIIEMFLESELLFDRSPSSLAAIYAYADAAANMPADQVTAIDLATQLPIWIFPAIRYLLVKTVELDFDLATNAEIAVADRIAGESLSEIRKSHFQALRIAPNLRPLIKLDLRC
ncbi:hypothetical protein M5G20_29295 [Pseudomonas sp. TNT2022 ID1044]|uniref:hypothetical protein n=1 Tax=Pseudomonas sp. TNT2022 ID1044 TaxID=2942636 RepID=UPI0023613E88|nr:hypothetical protein [Pseudomonas sp. TNT2022 ID1044]MDD0999937.1 hypothetical protein [Pseudomonas sp. TNT2022 ID1044]